MIETVEKFLHKHHLNTPDKTFLIGFSGGCDSLCMLDLLNEFSKKYGFKVVALHLNHNWRGDESLQDEQNCRRFCEKMGIEYISEVLENGERTETFAREARYNFFIKHAKDYPNSIILTAHTRTDNAETIIYRIIKGTGVKGIQGIPEKRIIDGIPVYRPLLPISRKKIQGYCQSKGLIANTDSSNLDISYKRNYIRHKIMPLFDEINFHAEKSIASLAKIATSQVNIVEEYISLIRKDISEGKRFKTEKFKQLSEDVMKKLIYDACLKKNLEYDNKKIENILEFIKSNWDSKAGSRYSLANDLWLFVNSKYLYLITQTKAEKNKNEIEISQEGEYTFPETDYIFSIKKHDGTKVAIYPKENELIAYVDLSETGLNFTLRTRRDGDSITPFGMNGSMKLKKYLNSKGISQHEKDELLLLCKESEVFWVAGVGLSNKFKVVNDPTHVLELKNKI